MRGSVNIYISIYVCRLCQVKAKACFVKMLNIIKTYKCKIDILSIVEAYQYKIGFVFK